MITLSDESIMLELPSDLEWEDEHNWAPVAQAISYTLGGALVVETSLKRAGRPITLAAGEDRAWMHREDLDVLYELASEPGKVLTLLLRSTSRQVVWRHSDGAIDAEQVMFVDEPTHDSYYRTTLRFMEV